jgi:transposase
MHSIGELCTEQLDIVPVQLRVRVTRRPRYGCRACEGAVVWQRHRHARSMAASQPKLSLCTSSSANSVILCRYIGSRKCWPGRVFRWIARH